MENHLQNPAEVLDHPSVAPDELLLYAAIFKRGENFVPRQVAISETLFRQSSAHAASQILLLCGAKFSLKEQRYLEHILSLYSGTIRTTNKNPICIYIVVVDTVTEVDGEEIVTLIFPIVLFRNPCESMNGQHRNYPRYFARSIQAMGDYIKNGICVVNLVVRKYGALMQCEEVKEDSDIGGDCSICLTDYTVGSQVIRLPCHHSFCTRCTLLWLIRNGSCPLCRYRLIPESTSRIIRP